MKRIKEFFKGNSTIVKIYEDIGMLRYYIVASKNARKAQKLISKHEIDHIKKFKNIHDGERCFIVGSGPSLKLEDLEAIKEELSFGVNSDYKIYDRTSWRPKYFVIMDDSAFDIFGEECYTREVYDAFFYSVYHSVDIPNGVRLADNAANHFVIGTIWNKLFPRIFPIAKYSNDIADIVYSGKTVVYPVIQIAAYMGFKEIYLLGVDCNYSGKQHADGMDYATLGVLPEGEMERNALMMRLQFEEMKKKLPKDVMVYNASEGSTLDIFPKKVLKDLKE